jgi:RimJ/RimL family protein N-acetyltransferase
MRLFLQTDRLLLRYADAADAELLYELNSDPDVTRYLIARPLPRERIETDVLPIFLAGPDGADPRYWIAVEKASGESIGGFALDTPPDEPKGDGELGYRFRRKAWGKGYASEGARAVIDKGFRDFGLERIWAQTMAVNLRSRRVMETAGLTYVRTFHLEWDEPIEGVEQGEVEYALTRAEWLAAAEKR